MNSRAILLAAFTALSLFGAGVAAGGGPDVTIEVVDEFEDLGSIVQDIEIPGDERDAIMPKRLERNTIGKDSSVQPRASEAPDRGSAEPAASPADASSAPPSDPPADPVPAGSTPPAESTPVKPLEPAPAPEAPAKSVEPAVGEPARNAEASDAGPGSETGDGNDAAAGDAGAATDHSAAADGGGTEDPGGAADDAVDDETSNAVNDEDPHGGAPRDVAEVLG